MPASWFSDYLGERASRLKCFHVSGSSIQPQTIKPGRPNAAATRGFRDAEFRQIFRLWLPVVLHPRSIDPGAADAVHSCFALRLNPRLPDGASAAFAAVRAPDLSICCGAFGSFCSAQMQCDEANRDRRCSSIAHSRSCKLPRCAVQKAWLWSPIIIARSESSLRT